ncbi:MAG: hypoxanthine phosphoribosyltransferase [Desulfobacteraceae bacterium 4572_130]|nr:MAG: hypoxanthine phosphoribosyltransferase [Desulfobacteraceae bacterium 4572_130]
MGKLIPRISEQKIKEKIKETGNIISKDYKNKNLVLMGILKGSFLFLADLTRNVLIDHEIDFVGASSYSGTSTTGKITFTKKPDLDLKNKHVLLVEDIIDTGRTFAMITKHIKSLKPASLKICTLIDKHERREIEINVDYSCFTIKRGFIVGYGLDYNEKYRNLTSIFDLEL